MVKYTRAIKMSEDCTLLTSVQASVTFDNMVAVLLELRASYSAMEKNI